MNESVDDQVELALFTLARFLPYGYPKESTLDVVNGAVKYISLLYEKIQEPAEIKCEPPEPIPPIVSDSSIDISGDLIDLSGAEENLILQELGLGVLYDSDTFSDIYSECETKSQESESKSVETASKSWEPQSKSSEPQSKSFETVSKSSEPESKSLETVSKSSELESKSIGLPIENEKRIMPLIKRPLNGFIRYAAKTRKLLLKVFPTKDNREISKLLGIMWRKLPPGERRRYNDSFSREISNIKAQFPEWNYAASRAKCNNVATKLNQTSQILPTRLRKQSPKNYKRMLGKELDVNSKKLKFEKVKKKATDNDIDYSPKNYKMTSGMKLVMGAEKPKLEKVKRTTDNDIDYSSKNYKISSGMDLVMCAEKPKLKQIKKKATGNGIDYSSKNYNMMSGKELVMGAEKPKLEKVKRKTMGNGIDYSPKNYNMMSGKELFMGAVMAKKLTLEKVKKATDGPDYSPKRSPEIDKMKSGKEWAKSVKKPKLEKFKKEDTGNDNNNNFFPKMENMDTRGFEKIEDVANQSGNFTINFYTKAEDQSLLPLKKRKEKKTKWAECLYCHQWRKLPSEWKKSDVQEPWYCFMNPDMKYRSCKTWQQES